MASGNDGASKSVNKTPARKRVEAETASSGSLKRAKNGSAFTRCEECNKDVAVALISMHSCSLDAKIKMNLEALVVEVANETKKKPVEKKKPLEGKDQSSKKGKKEKKEKDPNKPKRPPTAFFIFMDDFRKTYKEANPDCKKISMAAKEGGEKWKSMTDEEKKVYVDRAAELKEEYQKKVLESKNDAENEINDADEESNEDAGAFSGKKAKAEEISDDE